jgi:hypothetical protein
MAIGAASNGAQMASNVSHIPSAEQRPPGSVMSPGKKLRQSSAGSRHASYACFLVQTVIIPAVLVHCHCVFRTSLANGFGLLHPIARKPTAQASVEIATRTAIRLRFHKVGVIAITPVPVRPTIGLRDWFICDRIHTSVALTDIVIGP